MKMKCPFLIATAMVGFGLPAPAQLLFDSGSDGSMGALNVTANTNITLPPDGIFRFTTVTIAGGTTVTFTRNALNTPVHILATGDVTISGAIDISGGSGNSVVGGAGGPGGFDGGKPGFGSSSPAGAGYGPGGGRPGPNNGGPNGAGGGGHATRPDWTSAGNTSTNHGTAYGSPLLVPLAGGSGGAGWDGSPGMGGGGGGGAILIGSNTKIALVGSIFALGSSRASGAGGFPDGAGGAVRLVAPVVQGNGTINVLGANGDTRGGQGRIRIDTINRTGMSFNTQSITPSVGAFMTSFAPGNPKLDIIHAAGTDIPEGTGSPVTVSLPFGSDPNRNIIVQARNFNAQLPIEVVLTPDSGKPVVVQAQIDNVAGNPATVTVPVTFPINTPVAVNAWRR